MREYIEFIDSLLAAKAAWAVGACDRTPTWISAMSGAAASFPVPLTEIVGFSTFSSATLGDEENAKVEMAARQVKLNLITIRLLFEISEIATPSESIQGHGRHDNGSNDDVLAGI